MIENTLFESHFDLIPFRMYVVEVETLRLVYCNKVLRDSVGNCEGLICYKVLHEKDRPCAFCRIRELLGPDGLPNNKTIVFELFNEKDDCWRQMQDKTMRWPDGRIVKYSIAVDISELKQTQNRLAEAHAELALKNRELRAVSETDPLTGAFNRLKLERVLDAEINRALRYDRSFSIILLDLDCFKSVNELQGRRAGDVVLKKLVRLVSAHIRRTDALGRWGEEELLIVAPETPRSNAVTLAESLRKLVAETDFEQAGGLTASLGVAGYRHGESVDSLLARAEKALQTAKERGRNRVETAPATRMPHES